MGIEKPSLELLNKVCMYVLCCSLRMSAPVFYKYAYAERQGSKVRKGEISSAVQTFQSG